ncbi:MAG TPA: fatty acid metabolism transcriptional regulator FadR [Anaerolineae bacterium]|nr:fatty acid metabolism transcriptional regulator FadR [Anaerolineae bacterium]HQK15144.1 fatty acid metabolism transcriptional regulator FadR [Anaerolineae bacterium]
MTNTWSAPQRPAFYAEQALINAILDGTYPPGSALPAERELAAQLGVTRPTLREALQRMERDGWISIRQGKSTLVRDIWTEGGLNVLSSLARYGNGGVENHIPFDFVSRLLEVRLALAPAYARAAALGERYPTLITYLNVPPTHDDTADTYTHYDWQLHYRLTVASCNPIYTLILNGFEILYANMGHIYFMQPEARAASSRFYAHLLDGFQRRDADAVENVTRAAMAESLLLWKTTQRGENLSAD